MDKNIIARNFSRCAHLYDRYADIQQKAALRLLRQIKKNSFLKILEIGCGTGNYTLLLKKRFAHADLKAIDISAGMIDVARSKPGNKGVEFLTGDAENVTFKGRFDLITSNACFQWLENLESSLIKYKDWLEDNGMFCFSMFGPLTFWELNAVIAEDALNNPVPAANFIDKDKIKEILKSNFKVIRFREIKYTESLFSLKHLLKKIKYTGVRGTGHYGPKVFTPCYLAKLQKRYLDKFKEIRATYQVFYFLAKKG